MVDLIENYIKLEEKFMKTVYLASAIIFTVLTVAHLTRLLTGAEVIIEGWVVPLWVSGVGVLVAGTLAFKLWRNQ